MLASTKRMVGRALHNSPRMQLAFKRLNEWAFWRKTLFISNGVYYNKHMEPFYTSFFDIDKSRYSGKRIADIGCGPIGTLEWADNTAERVGIDPLADRYRKMNGGTQAMSYVAAPSEKIPFPDGYFDVVTMFNALDHVENVPNTIRELARITKTGGDILIITEINHPPSITEPHNIGEDIVSEFRDCDVVSSRVFGIRPDHNVYQSLSDRLPHSNPSAEGILCVHLRKAVDARLAS